MPEVKTVINLKIAGGPELIVNNVEHVEAYDVIEVNVAAGAEDQVVQLQPVASDQVSLMLVQSDGYDADGKVSFLASNGSDDSATPVLLTGPQLFGRGMTGLFGVDVKQLKFTNELAEPVRVRVIVGRDASAP